MSPQQRLCARCKSSLPENSGYCVGCGFDNGLFAEKLVKVQKDLTRAQERAQKLAMLNKLLWFFRWLG